MDANPRFMHIIPRVVRLRDAAHYLGMDKNRFNEEVRPHLTEIPVGTQGVGFDRLDLDEWFDDYKARNGHPGKSTEGGETWGKKSRQDCVRGVKSGTSGKGSAATLGAFKKVVARVTSKKQSVT